MITGDPFERQHFPTLTVISPSTSGNLTSICRYIKVTPFYLYDLLFVLHHEYIRNTAQISVKHQSINQSINHEYIRNTAQISVKQQ